MVEVLVSLVVISVGLLGMSGLQIASVKGTNNAHSRTLASMLSMELSERMRANPQGVDAGHYGVDEDKYADDAAVVCADGIPNSCSSSTYCSPEHVAANDIFEITCGTGTDNGIKNQLVNGSLEINVNGVEHDIMISWNASLTDKDQDDSFISQQLSTKVTP